MASIFKGGKKILNKVADLADPFSFGLAGKSLDLVGLGEDGAGFEGAKAGLPAQALNQPPATMPVQGTVAEKRSQRRKAAAEVRRRRGRSSTILTALDGDEGTLG